VSASSLVYRGYCAACEVPAIVGSQGALICPRCQQLVVMMPPPDQLVLRWFPLDGWTRSLRQRRGRAAASMAKHLQTMTPECQAELALNLIEDEVEEQPPQAARAAGDDAPDGEDTSAFAV
jgi:hypothetical protein